MTEKERSLELFNKWNQKICRGFAKDLAEQCPDILVAWIDMGFIPDSTMTFAAEYLGTDVDSETIRHTLIPLLDHQSAVVREGAILGLSRHRNDEVNALLQQIAKTDASPAVREVAEDFLSD